MNCQLCAAGLDHTACENVMPRCNLELVTDPPYVSPYGFTTLPCERESGHDGDHHWPVVMPPGVTDEVTG